MNRYFSSFCSNNNILIVFLNFTVCSRMAYTISSRHGTSDEYHDPYCDPCHQGKGLNVEVHCYCNDCVQYLCSHCYLVHGQLKSSRRHLISLGDDMPRSHAEKLPKFEKCESHSRLPKDRFCSDHRTLLCSTCCAADHSTCAVDSVDNTCKSIPASATDDLYKIIEGYKEKSAIVLSFIAKHSESLEDQKKTILKDTQKIYEQVLAYLEMIYQDVQNEVKAQYESQAANLSKSQRRLTDIKARLEAVAKDVEKFKGKTIDTKIFISLQELVDDVGVHMSDFKDASDSLCLETLTFSPSRTMQDIMSSSFTFGAISKSISKHTPSNPVSIDVMEIKFPVSPIAQSPAVAAKVQRSTLASGSPSTPLKQVRASKIGSYNVRLKGDKFKCFVSGIAITRDGKKILVDYENQKIKLFSPNLGYLSSVSIPGELWDVTVLSDQEAVVTVGESFVILSISGRRVHIKETTQLSDNVAGITKFKDKIVVINAGFDWSVKIIDRKGKEYLSVSRDQHGKPLFKEPFYVASFVDKKSSRVIVTDYNAGILTLLNGDTGGVITRYEVKNTTESGIGGVTVDTGGNIYICTYNDILVLSPDLSREKILIKGGQLSASPQAIAYDELNHQIIVSFGRDLDNIDCFQLV